MGVNGLCGYVVCGCWVGVFEFEYFVVVVWGGMLMYVSL